VRQRDRNDPMVLLEPNEQIVARLLAAGLTNEQIAARLGFQDKRTISRANGQIYAAWNLVDSTTDEKVARTRAAIIVHTGRILRWDEAGTAYALDAEGAWTAWSGVDGDTR
jgi:DNA-binding NarL/FixJ family response regulator